MQFSIRLNTVARCVLAIFVLSVISTAVRADSSDLSGTWEVELASGAKHPVELPGSLQGSRIGDAITVATKWTGGIFNRAWYDEPEYAAYRKPDHLKVPFWLQPETHYVGAATYRRSVDIPPGWSGRRIVLTLERPHWKTTVWLDDRRVGSNDAMSVAHEYDLGADLSPGPHRLTIRVDNTHDPDIGENSHSISDHTQGNWNGIVGRIELSSTPRVWIEDVAATTRIADRAVLITGSLGRVGAEPWPKTVRIDSSTPAGTAIDAAVASDGRFTATYGFGKNVRLWDEFDPALYSLIVTLANGEREEIVVGFRELRVDGRQLILNDEPLYLRGTLDVAAFPRTGHPPTDIGSWRRVFGTIKSHGLNHVRFHSWCPPEAAFIAADQLGVYLQAEAATWPNWSTTIGDGKPVDAWVEAETRRILRAYGNHPSFVMFSNGNEPGGEKHAQWLAAWVKRHKAADPRRLYNAGAGWPEVPENDYHVLSEPRIQHWLEGLESRVNARPPETRADYGGSVRAHNRPVVSHEIGQWAVFPNFAEMPKYTGYLKPRNFEIFRETLAANGLAAREHDFLMASGKLQALLYKEEIESALRTPGFGGFQLLSLQDFPGQGTALVGILDAFWEEKGYISPQEFRRFSGSIVPLARLDKRVFMKNEQLVADIELANFGRAALRGATTSWRLTDVVGKTVAHGRFPARNVPLGAGQLLGRLDVSLASLPAPARYRLEVNVSDPRDAARSGEAIYSNDWDIWVYPTSDSLAAKPPAGVIETQELTAEIAQKLQDGANVLLTLPPSRVAPDSKRGPIALGFSSIFWNTAWTNGQAPHTLGIFCDPKHAALRGFPTDSHSNWQWWYPIHDAAPMILDGFAANLQPIVSVIDDWFTNRRLALVFEARVGKGRILVTSIAFEGAPLNPVSRQLRTSLRDYIASGEFEPPAEATLAQVSGLTTR